MVWIYGPLMSIYHKPLTPPSTLCCSWRLASASLPQVQFWITQLCCLCS